MDKNYLLQFVYYWIVNIILFSLAYAFYPNAFELSNINIAVVPSAIFSAFLFTVLTCLARGCAKARKITNRGRIFMFLYYWAVSSAGIWIVARMANVSGFGIARYTWAIGLGFVSAFVHWRVRQSLKGITLAK